MVTLDMQAQQQGMTGYTGEKGCKNKINSKVILKINI
jgi:hypothetical protein